LCVSGEVGEGGGECEGPRGTVNAYIARRDERAGWGGCSECESRLITGCLHGEREDECPDTGGAVAARLEMMRHDSALVLCPLHVEFGEWRGHGRRQHIRLDDRGIDECRVGAS